MTPDEFDRLVAEALADLLVAEFRRREARHENCVDEFRQQEQTEGAPAHQADAAREGP
jgi:hypothetical protein